MSWCNWYSSSKSSSPGGKTDKNHGSKFLCAMKAGEIEVVKAMLDHDEIDCDVKFKIHGQYESAIEIAVKCQQIKAVRALCEAGCNTVPHRCDSFPPLLMATINNDFEMVKLLLDFKAAINTPWINGRTALFYAMNQPDSKIFDLLVTRGANVNKTDSHGDCILKLTCLYGTWKQIETLLNVGANPLKLDEAKTSILQHVCVGNYLDSRQKMTLLLDKIKYQSKSMTEAVKFLNHSSHAFDPAVVLLTKNWPEHRDRQVLVELLEAGADPNAHSVCGHTALMIASQEGYKSLVRILIFFGATLKVGGSSRSPLVVAATHGHAEIVDILLQSSQDIRCSGQYFFQEQCATFTPEVAEIIQTYQTTPLTLKALCRISLKNSQYPEECQELPEILKRYVAFDKCADYPQQTLGLTHILNRASGFNTQFGGLLSPNTVKFLQ